MDFHTFGATPSCKKSYSKKGTPKSSDSLMPDKSASGVVKKRIMRRTLTLLESKSAKNILREILLHYSSLWKLYHRGRHQGNRTTKSPLTFGKSSKRKSRDDFTPLYSFQPRDSDDHKCKRIAYKLCNVSFSMVDFTDSLDSVFIPQKVQFLLLRL